MRILTEGDPESDNVLKSLLINDAMSNPAYNIDFTKFLATVTGSGGAGMGAAGLGGPVVGAGPAASAGLGHPTANPAYY